MPEQSVRSPIELVRIYNPFFDSAGIRFFPCSPYQNGDVYYFQSTLLQRADLSNANTPFTQSQQWVCPVITAPPVQYVFPSNQPQPWIYNLITPPPSQIGFTRRAVETPTGITYERVGQVPPVLPEVYQLGPVQDYPNDFLRFRITGTFWDRLRAELDNLLGRRFIFNFYNPSFIFNTV